MPKIEGGDSSARMEGIVKSHKVFLFTLALLVAMAMTAPLLNAQSLTQGDVVGTITDPSGAVVPGVTITLKSDNTGETRTAKTNSTGFYHVALLSPGPYTLTVSAPNYQTTTQRVSVAVGQSTTSNLKLAVQGAQTTVEVTAEGSVVQTATPGVSTTMSSAQIALIPNGGGDLSYIAQTAPGSMMNITGGGGFGYGNFSSFGLPGISNNFTTNSMPENDPFLSLNNSGATNILLGQNDTQEATVVSNGYSGEYSLAGANVNYVSKSGTNSYHGNAIWRWNGTTMNANNYFNNQTTPPQPRGFVNDNQWAASFGGPIKKDKSFFFVNTEGLWVFVPVTQPVRVPTRAWQSAVLANIGSTQPTALPLYQSMFNIYNNAPGSGLAANILNNGGCADFTGTLGFGAGSPCALQYNSTQSQLTNEYQITGRYDQNFGVNDKMFIHFKMDRGTQATITDPLNPVFNVTSFQPQYEGQLQWTHTFSPNTVNSFSVNGSYYRAIFVQPQLDQALALQPLQVKFTGNTLFSLGNFYSFPAGFPQGRNVTQYGFVDDFSRTMGKHTVKLGANLARYDITDYDPSIGSLPAVTSETMTDFFNGIGTNFQQTFPTRLTQPVALYRLGFYGQDKWQVKSNLSLTLALRVDRNSNPACRTNCFSRLVAPFGDINHDLTTPYNQSVLANQELALPSSYSPWTIQPRIGFNYSPFGGGNTVISGGFGIFGDTFPAGYVDNLMNNLPGAPAFIIPGLPFAPATPGNGGNAAAAAANALTGGFANGATFASLNSQVLAATGGATGFSVPNFFNVGQNIHVPRYQEWDLQVQQAFGSKTALTLKYVGNHGIYEQIPNNSLNAYCGPTVTATALAAAGTGSIPTPCLSSAGVVGALPVTSFAGLPTLPTDQRFLGVNETTSGFNSNYNGVTVSFLRRLSSFQFQLNYTWSHAMDFLSNNGVGPTEPFTNSTNTSITNPQNPFNVRQNMYGNADYDVRHYFSANYVYTTPRGWMHGILGNVTIGGTIFARTGIPLTVQDSGTGGTLAGYGYGGVNTSTFGTFADQTGAFFGTACNGKFANPDNGPCPGLAGNFTSSTTGFGNQRRNQVIGPRFFDTDMTLSKGFHIPGWEAGVLTFGITAYNLFNHPNFDQPVGDVAASNFGSITTTANPPTSIYGAALGADSSPRLLQTQIKLTF